MIGQPSLDDLDRIDAVFNRVLAAEASARESVEQCRQEAQGLVAAAEARERRLADQVDARIRAVQRIADRSLQEALARLLKPVAEPAQVDPDEAARARLTRAVGWLAHEMIGIAETGGETAGRVAAEPSPEGVAP